MHYSRYLYVFTFFLFLNIAGIFYCKAQLQQEVFNTLNVSYFGKSVTRTGFKAGTILFSYNFKPHIRNNGNTILRQLGVPANMGFYFHPGNHFGWFLNTGFGYKTVLSKGFFWQFDVEAGYLRTFLTSSVYEVDDRGNINRVFLAGRNQFMPGIGFTCGKNLNEQNKRFNAIYGRAGGFLQYPYNTMWLPNLILEIGTIINLE